MFATKLPVLLFFGIERLPGGERSEVVGEEVGIEIEDDKRAVSEQT
jgi:hypothetical protein